MSEQVATLGGGCFWCLEAVYLDLRGVSRVVSGYAGSAADALALFERLEAKLDEYSGNLSRAVVETAKLWRTDKVLRRLEAYLIVADQENMFLISGNGDLIEPDDGIVAVGSGGPYAQAAARALVRHSNMTSTEIAKEAMKIAAEICIYTNDHITVEEIDVEAATRGKKNSKDKG